MKGGPECYPETLTKEKKNYTHIATGHLVLPFIRSSFASFLPILTYALTTNFKETFIHLSPNVILLDLVTYQICHETSQLAAMYCTRRHSC